MYAAAVHTAVSPERCWRVQELLTEKSKRREGMDLSGRDAVMALAFYDKGACGAQRSGCGQAIFSWFLSNLLLEAFLLWLMWTSLVLYITSMQFGSTRLHTRLETGVFHCWENSDLGLFRCQKSLISFVWIISMFIYMQMITLGLEKRWVPGLRYEGFAARWGLLKWQRLGVIVWRRWKLCLEDCCHSLEEKNRTEFELWDRRGKNLPHKVLKQFILGTWRIEVTYFTWLSLPHPMHVTTCNSQFCWWKRGSSVFCPTCISSLYLSIQYHIPYGII